MSLVKHYLPDDMDWRKLARESHYHPGEAAKLKHVSLRTLERWFQAHLGKTVRAAFLELRRAAEETMLLQGIKNAAVAQQSGYKNRSYFYEEFRKAHGCSPRQFASPQSVAKTYSPAIDRLSR